MDDPIIFLAVIVFVILTLWGIVRRWSGDYEDESELDYDEKYSNDDGSDSSWSSPSRHSSIGGSSYRSSGSSSVSKSQPTKTYDSPKIQSHGGFGRSKK